MAYTTPRTWQVGSTLTAADLNEQLSANLAVANRWAINYSATGTFTSGIGDGRMTIPYPITVDGITVQLSTKPVGGSFVLDLQYTTQNGSTWLSAYATSTANRPTITTTGSFTTAPAPGVSSFTSGNTIRLQALSTLVSATNMMATIAVSGA